MTIQLQPGESGWVGPLPVGPAVPPGPPLPGPSLASNPVLARRLLILEIVVVLTVGILPSTGAAIVDLVRNLVTHQLIVNAPVYLPGHPAADIALGIMVTALATSPVLLVWYLLARSGESFASIGLDRCRLGTGILLALGLMAGLFFTEGVLSGLFGALNIHGLATSVAPAQGPWYLVEFLFRSARAGLLEEILVCGYLLHRLRQLGWSDSKALWASTALRASYHVYGGIPLVALTILMGLAFGRIYQRSRRLLPLILGHALYDGVLFAVYLLHR